MKLADLTWAGGERLDRYRVAIIPMAPFAQHDHHLLLFTGTIFAKPSAPPKKGGRLVNIVVEKMVQAMQSLHEISYLIR